MSRGRSPDFWYIMKGSFPEAHEAHARELQHDLELERRMEEISAERQALIYQASMDPAIADCLLFDNGETEELIAYLQGEHGLTEEEARNAADIGLHDPNEVVDYGDEA